MEDDFVFFFLYFGDEGLIGVYCVCKFDFDVFEFVKFFVDGFVSNIKEV